MRPLVIALVLAACADKAEPGAIEVGMTLATRDEHGAPLTLRIDAIARDPGDDDVYLYDVSFRTPGGLWEPYCEPDAEHRISAVVVKGGWDAAGDYIASDAVTFACTNGAIAKCVRWGYKPWKTGLAAYHQTCMRVVLADYCGDGRAHTRDGTRINVYDRLGIETRDDLPGTFEAAWTPSGAVYLNEPRRAVRSDVVGECPARLSDRAEKLTEAQVRARFPDALIFTETLR